MLIHRVHTYSLSATVMTKVRFYTYEPMGAAFSISEAIGGHPAISNAALGLLEAATGISQSDRGSYGGFDA